MIRDLLKWVAPGLVVVFGGTAAALATTAPGAMADLSSRSQAVLSQADLGWARLAFDGRNVNLSGTVVSGGERDLALMQLRNVPGIGAVDHMVVIAPLADPYIVELSVEDSTLTLSGSVPNEELKARLQGWPGLAVAQLDIRAGQPDENLWQAGLLFALEQASLVEEGRFELSGLTLSLEGRAISERALGALQMALAEPPAGIALGQVAVEPVRAAPYTWTAEFDGERIAVSGHVPEARLAERLRLADVSGVPVATGLTLASGAPEGFAERSRLLLEQLARLENGRATIIDGESRLTGTPPSIEIAQTVTETLSGTGSIVELSPPTIPDYWVSISRQPGGTLVFDGYAPDRATRDAFAAVSEADVSWLKLGSGAPAGYRAAVDFGLDLLGRLSEGRFALRGNVVTLSGIAASPADYRAVSTALRTAAPQGLVVVMAEVQAPRAASYQFVASRRDGGNIVLSGMVPSPDIETMLLAEAGSGATSALTYASGEPPNFLAAVEQALAFLPWLTSGEVRYDGVGWQVRGTPASSIDKGAIETEFAVNNLAQAGWSLALADPTDGPPPADPYLWSAERLADGSMLFEGHAPAEALKAYLAVHAGGRVSDNTVLAGGAPEGFATQATAALDALLALETGRVAFDGAAWSLAGQAADDAARNASLAALAQAEITVDGAQVLVPDPYLWSAEKSGDGTVRLTGSVPAETVQRFVAMRAGDRVTDQTAIDPDAPAGFEDQVLRALDILALLSEGTIAFDGEGWTATGQGGAPGAATAAAGLLGDTGAEWQLAIAEPVAPVAEAEPVRTAEAAAPETPAQAVDPAYAFLALRDAAGTVSLSGQVPAAATARYFGSIAKADPSGLSIAPGAPQTFLADAEAGLRALLLLEQGELRLASGQWSLTGRAAGAAQRGEVEATLAGLGRPWSTNIEVPPAIDLCRDQVAALSAQNAILFQSGAALIADGAGPVLDAFAAALALCPDAEVHVEGHTDSDGDDQLNLALSVARAEAVVEALIARGVSPARLYAIGYGESRPVADNATADGKRQNRRIVVTVGAGG